MVQHANIPDSDIHEPKGAASAQPKTLYVANGSGSGSWTKIDAQNFRGLTGDGGVAGLKLMSVGDDSFQLVKDYAYGQMGIEANTNAFTATAAADPTLNTTGDYIFLTGTGAPWAAGPTSGPSSLGNRLVVDVAGVYKLSLNATVTSFPSSTAKVAFKVRINGGAYAPRKAIVQAVVASSTGQAVMDEIVVLAAGAVLQVYVATTNAGGITISDLSLMATLIRAT